MIPRMSCKKKPDPNKEDFKLELAFAKRYLKGEVTLWNFPYCNSYEDTIEKEVSHAPGNILVVGCGPFPISVMLLGEYTDGLDSSKTACEYARKVLDKYDTGLSCVFHSKAEEFEFYHEYSSIILTLEAGTTLKKKRKILNVIHSHIQSDAFLIVRSSKTPEFVQVEEAIDARQWTTVDSFDVFDGLSTSFVLQKL